MTTTNEGLIAIQDMMIAEASRNMRLARETIKAAHAHILVVDFDLRRICTYLEGAQRLLDKKNDKVVYDLIDAALGIAQERSTEPRRAR